MNERQMDKVLREKYPFTDSSKGERDTSKSVVDQLGEPNVLNSYRSITYNFTLAALKKGYLSDPKKYRESELELVILKSGGKGDLKMTATIAGGINAAPQSGGRGTPGFVDPRRLDISEDEKKQPLRNYGNELVDGFNSESPGRFDMYIEDVSIDTLMAFTESGGTTLPTQIKFEIIEPYSINGFIEALHVAAISAGYASYLQASFVLKMDFWGYPDQGDFPDPEKIPKATRYFPLGLTGIEVDISEKGTRYRCTAVPFNERSFGEPNTVKKPIQMYGNTVSEILTIFMMNMNLQVSIIEGDDGKVSATDKHNIYKVKFPSWVDGKGWTGDTPNKIASSKLAEILKDNILYKMVDPATTEKATAYHAQGTSQPSPSQQAKEPEAVKYTPNKTVVQFPEGANIHEIISSVVRDSEYSREILRDVKKNIDQYGMLDYFMVKIETENLDVYDEKSKNPFQTFTYVITPYKVHYTKIPSYGQSQIDPKNLKKLSLRQYNYIYTGKNIDIINFKLNFNTLFFEAVPAAMGNKDVPSAKTGAAPDNGVNVKQGAVTQETVKAQQVPTHPTKTQVTPVQQTGGNAGQPKTDAYSEMAKKMHSAIIDSKASMITGEIEISGDPFYIATGGVGNYVSTPESRGKTTDGEADHIYGQILITINFQNPIDINPDTGMMYFDPKLIPFSGVYSVQKVSSTFKNGEFKQKLEIIRIPGQILDLNITPTDPNDLKIVSPDSQNVVRPDTTRAESPSQRIDSSTVMDQLDRGLPSPGLPGELSNFTNATGGLGGTMLNATPGLSMRASDLASGSFVIGNPLPTDLSSNIRLSASGLADLTQTNLGSSAALASASKILSGNNLLSSSVNSLAGSINSNAITNALKISNIGSGIGEGATLKLSSAITDPTGLDIKFGANINPTKLNPSSVTSLIGSSNLNNLVSGLGTALPGNVGALASGITNKLPSLGNSSGELGTAALGAVSSLGSNVGSLVGGVKDKIAGLGGSSSDPSAIGARVGLDVSKLSGLGDGAGLQSKLLGQLGNVGSNLPTGVNLNQAAAAGVVLDYIPLSKMKNIPPMPPYATAPAAAPDMTYVKEVTAKGGVTGLANLYGVSDVKNISGSVLPPDLVNSALAAAPSFQNPLSNLSENFNGINASFVTDKLASAKSQISGLTGKIPIPDSGVVGSITSKFGSMSGGASPLDKLVSTIKNKI